MERYLINLINELNEGFQMLSNNFEYLYINNAALKHGRLKREGLIGKKMTDIFPAVSETDMFKTLQHCLKTQCEAQFEHQFYYPDGSYCWFELRIYPVVEGLIILSLDISNRKEAEKVKDDYIRKLEELITFTSHRLRQPITKIMAISDSLKEPSSNINDKEVLLTMLKDSSDIMDSVTRELTNTIISLKQDT